MPTSPTIEWRNSTTPFAVITNLALTGTGSSGAVPVGTTSNTSTVRVYNNFASAGGIADATSCTLACYDDVVHQGSAATVPVTSLYLGVQVTNYNGVTTGADSAFFSIGGITKHAVPVNSGTLGGGASNYITVNIQVVIPATATQGSDAQGVWLEYNSTA